MLVAGQSFLIIFREGFEVVLLLSVLLGYLEAAKSPQFIKPILVGVGLAAVATVLTVLADAGVFSLLPVGREVLEAITALVAVAVLFYVSFWLIARLEHKRWMEFVRARLWSAVSLGSAASLVPVGFTAVYREGLRDRALLPVTVVFGAGLGALRSCSASASASSPSPASRSLVFQLGRQAAGAHVHEHRRRAGHGDVGRVPRQRRPRAAGRRRDHATRRTERPEPADLPRRGDRLLADGAVARRPGRADRRLRARRPLLVRRPSPASQPRSRAAAAHQRRRA